MLFQKIYNWIKYKTLPASFLFRNRLFVERDTKNKRIFSNFGSHFKGSKWRTYASYSINFFFQPKYLESTIRFLLHFFAFVLFCLYSNYYAKMPLLNSFFYLAWSCADCVQYFLVFITWCLVFFCAQVYKLYYFYSNFNNFSKEFPLNFLDRSAGDFQLYENSFDKKKFISKEDIDFYSNLWSQKTKLNDKTLSIQKSFEHNSKNLNWTKKNNFFKNNYSVHVFSTKTINNFNDYFFNHMLYKSFSKTHASASFRQLNFLIKTTFYKNKLLTNHLSSNAPHSEFLTSPEKNPSNNYFNSSFEWSISSIFTSNSAFKLNSRNKLGAFFLKDNNQKDALDFELNTDELTNFEKTIKNVSCSAKVARWLYKYSLVHRKSVKFASKISASKRTALWSHKDRNVFSKNLWKSATLRDKNQISLFFNNFTLNCDTIWFNRKFVQSTPLIGFYEQSYLWLIKKFYFFNSSNKVKTFFQFSPVSHFFKDEASDLNENLANYSQNLNHLQKSFISVNNLFFFNQTFFEDSFLYQMRFDSDNFGSAENKDVFVSFFSASLFYDNLVKFSLLHDFYLTKTPSFSFVSFVLNQKTFNDYTPCDFEFNPNLNKESFSFLPYLLIVESENSQFEKDLKLFLLTK